MKSWVIGFILGLIALVDSLFTPVPLSLLNGAVGVFLWFVVLVNYYGKR
jgi:hypothetical protein